MSGVFVNYRRLDETYGAGLIHKCLSERLGADQVFLDSCSLRLGRDFEPTLWSALRSSDALVVVIGPKWLSEENGQLLISRSNDFVRREVAEALRLDLLVIPVLLGGVPLPDPSMLPDDIKALCKRKFAEIGTNDPLGDINKFIIRLISEARLQVVRPAAPDAPGSLVTATNIQNDHGAIAIGFNNPTATNISIGHDHPGWPG